MKSDVSGPKELVCAHNASKTTCLGDRIQVADSGWDRSVGLLGRRTLDAGAGLLIVPTQAVHTFFMAFAIDLIFVDKHFRVIAVRPDLRPWRISGFHWRALGVLELPTGTIQRSQTAVGDQLRIESVQTGRPIA